MHGHKDSQFESISILTLPEVQLRQHQDTRNILLPIASMPGCLLKLSLGSFNVILQAHDLISRRHNIEVHPCKIVCIYHSYSMHFMIISSRTYPGKSELPKPYARKLLMKVELPGSGQEVCSLCETLSLAAFVAFSPGCVYVRGCQFAEQLNALKRPLSSVEVLDVFLGAEREQSLVLGDLVLSKVCSCEVDP